MNDVTFLINRIDGFHPRSDPDQFPVFLLANHPCISKWENEIGSAHPEPSEDEPEVTLDIEQELFEDLTRLCNVMEVSLPQLARAIFRFIADPETRDTANQWFGIRLQTPRDPAEPNHRSQI